jgi:hypothetical protein
MADADKILKILLSVKSDVADLNKVVEGLGGVRRGADDATKAGFGLKQAFEFAGANEAIHVLVETLRQIPERFIEAIKSGVEFNAHLQDMQAGIAGILRQTQGAKFVDFAAANAEAGNIVELLKSKANELGKTYESMFEGFSHAQQSMSLITDDVKQQIALFTTLDRAMASMSITGSREAKDIADLFRGAAANTAAGTQIAAGLHITVQELDQLIQKANQGGTAFQFWMTTLAGFQEAGRAMATNFNADVNRMHNSVTDLQSDLAKPIMQPLIDGMAEFHKLATDPETGETLRGIGAIIGQTATGALRLAENLAAAYKVADYVLPDSSWLFHLFGSQSPKEVFDTAQAEQFLETNGKILLQLKSQIEAAQTLDEKEAARQALNEEVNKLYQRANSSTGEMQRVALSLIQSSGILTNNFDIIAGSAEKTSHHLADSTKQLALQKQIEDQINLLTARTSGDAEAIAEQQAQSAADKGLATMKEKGVTQLEINGQLLTEEKVWQAIYDATYKEAIAVANKKAAQTAINDLLRKENDLLAGIREKQSVISANPLLSSDDKQSQLHAAYLEEQNAIAAQIPILQNAIDEQKKIGGQEAQANVERYTAELNKLTTQYTLLGFKVRETAGFTGQFQVEMVSWVNSFGTSAHQVAGVITGTLNTAIAQTSQLLTDAIFRTGDWKAALVAIGEAGVKSLIQMVLQWTISRTVMSALNAAFGKADAESSASLAGESAAAWSPAAVSASIATEGVAAGTGLAAYIAAIASGESVAVGFAAGGAGGFKKGGYTGEGDENAIAGPAHKREFVFDAGATRSHGIENLELLRRGDASIIPRFGDGGTVEPGRLRVPWNVLARTPQNQYPPPWWNPDPQSWTGTGAGQQQGPGFYGPGRDNEGNFTWNGRPFVESRIDIDPSLTREDTFVANDDGSYFSIPHQAMDFIEENVFDGSNVTGSVGDPFGGGSVSGDIGSGLPSGSGPVEAGGLFPGDPSGFAPPSITINLGDDTNPFGGATADGTATFRGFDPNTGQPLYVDSNGNTFDATGTAWDFTGTDVPWEDPNNLNLVPPGGDPFGGSIAGGTTGSGSGDPFGGSTASGGFIGVTPDGQPVFGDAEGNHFTQDGAPYTGSLNPGGRGLGGGPDPHTGEFFDYSSGSWQPYHTAGSFRDSLNQGAEESARDPVKFGMNPTGDEGHTVFNFTPPTVDSGDAQYLADWASYVTTAGGRANWQNFPHRAGGGRMDGAPSNVDSILAWLAPGEHVIPADVTAAADRKFGRDWPEKLAQTVMPMAWPHFADGGRVGSSFSSSSSSRDGTQPIKIINVTDWKTAFKEAQKDDDHRTFIVDTIKGRAHEIGIGAVN